MTGTIEAIYERGLLRPLQPLTLSEGMRVAIILLEPAATKVAVMREAMSDPLFLADLREVANDFKHVDAEVAVERAEE
jgi:predicted DNA-binding antitoxin AbrB/MazE fold protein